MLHILMKKINFISWDNNPISTFQLIKTTPQLTHITYTSCLNITNLSEIKNWCDSKRIKLEIN